MERVAEGVGTRLSADLRPRFVVLGASNVARGLRPLVGRVRGMHAGPVEILTAFGRGRSYGLTSRLLWSRELASIDACGLWPVLAARTAPTLALITDPGNDLVYGAEVEQIAGWIERALERLSAAAARSVVVGLPLASLERLGPLRFGLARRILFPGRSVDLQRVLEQARALDERIAALARAHSAAFVRPQSDWFGLDPIHVRFRLQATAWDTLLAPLSLPHAQAPTPRAFERGERALLGRLRPEFRRLFGREQRHAQPCVRFVDGTSLSWF